MAAAETFKERMLARIRETYMRHPNVCRAAIGALVRDHEFDDPAAASAPSAPLTDDDEVLKDLLCTVAREASDISCALCAVRALYLWRRHDRPGVDRMLVDVIVARLVTPSRSNHAEKDGRLEAFFSKCFAQPDGFDAGTCRSFLQMLCEAFTSKGLDKWTVVRVLRFLQSIVKDDMVTPLLESRICKVLESVVGGFSYNPEVLMNVALTISKAVSACTSADDLAALIDQDILKTMNSAILAMCDKPCDHHLKTFHIYFDLLEQLFAADNDRLNSQDLVRRTIHDHQLPQIMIYTLARSSMNHLCWFLHTRNFRVLSSVLNRVTVGGCVQEIRRLPLLGPVHQWQKNSGVRFYSHLTLQQDRESAKKIVWLSLVMGCSISPDQYRSLENPSDILSPVLAIRPIVTLVAMSSRSSSNLCWLPIDIWRKVWCEAIGLVQF